MKRYSLRIWLTIRVLALTMIAAAGAEAQWTADVIINSPDFGNTGGWVGSVNGSPWDCSGSSIQKNPQLTDVVWVTHTLETGYKYRYTFYIKSRQPIVYYEFREGPDEVQDATNLGWANEQTGSGDYTYTAGPFKANDSPAMVCTDTFKYTSEPIHGDGELHFLKVVTTSVQGAATSAPVRMDHCIIEWAYDETYLLPIPPKNLEVSDINKNVVVLGWEDKAINELGYIIQRMDAGGAFAPIDSTGPDISAYNDTITTAGSYMYRVYAYNGDGNSMYSNEVQASLYVDPPADPTGFLAVPVDSRRIDLSWHDNITTERGYMLEYRSDGAWMQVEGSPLDTNRTEYFLFGLEPETSYSFRLWAFNNIGNSDTVTTTVSTPASDADGIVFPEHTDILNVRDYGAVGDGITDDFQAIQNALNDGTGKIVYLPVGTYLVSDRLEWPLSAVNAPLILIGQRKESTIIKLSDNNENYQLPGIPIITPRAVIWTQEFGAADNYRNFIRNLTVNSGSGNPIAVGIQYMSNNMGSLMDADIVSGDGGGLIGLDFAYNGLNGPLLAKNISINGFDVGIKTTGSVNSQCLEHITLRGQNEYGIYNNGQVMSIRGLTSENEVPAVKSPNAGSVISLIDADLTGGIPANAAIDNSGGLFARNIHTEGYGLAIRNTAGHKTDSVGPDVSQFVSHNPATLFPWTRPLSLNLPVAETPVVPWVGDFDQWANVEDYGADGSDQGDDTQAIQDAVNSGKRVLFFPGGSYQVTGSIEIKGNIEKIIGVEATLAVGTQAEPVLRLVDSPSSPDTVDIQYMTVTPTVTTSAIDNESSGRTLVVKYCKGFGSDHTGTGSVFYEDVGTGVQKPLRFLGGKGQHAWIRQLSNEPREGVTHLVNQGGILWILGHKTEQEGTLIETSDSGKTEVCGAFAYSVGGGDNSVHPMYIVDNSWMSATMGGAYYGTSGVYTIMVEETQGNETRQLMASEVPSRAGFRMMPLYVGYPDDGTGNVPDAPAGLSAMAQSKTRINLAWVDKSYNEEGFVIEMKSPGGNFETLDSLSANVTVYQADGLSKGTVYAFRIFAYNELGNSAYSNEALDTTDTDVGIFPARGSVPLTITRLHPNPFREEVTLEYSLDRRTWMNVGIYDMTGRVVRTLLESIQDPGSYRLSWDGRDDSGTQVEAGICFCLVRGKTMEGQVNQIVRKLVRMR